MGTAESRTQVSQVAITFNSRTYRFQCGEGDAERLEKLANYVKSKLDDLMREHGSIGDERLVLMAAFTIADELFDARADIDELLEDQTVKLKSVAEEGAAKTAGENGKSTKTAKSGV
jgi:cell division protein ZapA